MTKNRPLIVLVIFWLIGVSHAHALPLWELQGTKNQILILGSIHFLRAEDYPLPDAIIRAYTNADIVVMELDLDDLDPLEMLQIIQRLATDPNGRTLEDLMGNRGYRTARDKAAEIDIDLASMMAYKPWYAAIQISQLRLMQLGFDASYGVETRFLVRAMQDGKEIGGLESLEEQLTALDSLSLKVQREYLLQTLDDATEIETTIGDIVTAWKAGDTKVLDRELLRGVEEQPQLYQHVLIDRNINWVEEISRYTQDSKNYLIVVGALHLVGDNSVLKMLDEEGYPSTQIRR